MTEKEKKLAADILDIFERLPEPQKHQLLGAAQGLDMSTKVQTEDEPKAS